MSQKILSNHLGLLDKTMASIHNSLAHVPAPIFFISQSLIAYNHTVQYAEETCIASFLKDLTVDNQPT